MKSAQPQSKKRIFSGEKAAAPTKGAAAFFCSTAFRLIPVGPPFPAISQHMQKEHAAIYNFLAEKDYFRPALAEGPVSNVVLTEGQGDPLGILREVAV